MAGVGESISLEEEERHLKGRTAIKDWWVRYPQSVSVTKATCSGIFFGTLSSSLSSPMVSYFHISSVGFCGAFCVFWPVSPVPASPLSAVVPWSTPCTLSQAHCSGSASTNSSAWLSGLSGAMPHASQPSVLPRINLPTRQAGNPFTISPSNLTLISTSAHLLVPSLPVQYLFCIFPSPNQSILNTELKCYLFCRAFSGNWSPQRPLLLISSCLYNVILCYPHLALWHSTKIIMPTRSLVLLYIQCSNNIYKR